jgi:hypothetical protein
LRKRRLLLLLISFVLLACTCGLPPIVIPTAVAPTAYVPPTEAPVATEYILVTEAPLAVVTPPTVVRLRPGGGSLAEQIRTEVRNAAALGQKPFVEFDATW